jgi:choline dehydrogenase
MPGVGSFLVCSVSRLKSWLILKPSMQKDHCGVYTLYRVHKNDAFARLLTDIVWVILELLKYILFGTGIFFGPVNEILVFAHSTLLSDSADILKPDPSTEPPKIPDIELQPLAVAASGYLPDNIKKDGIYSFLINHLQPHSHGTVRLASADPRANADVDLAFLTNHKDFEALRKGVKLSMRIADGAKNNGYFIESCDVPKDDSDETLDDFIRHHLRTTYHYSSTCRMAPENDQESPGVVDDELKVHGFDNLRVADCSVFPDILAAHLQAPAVMIGEKCADMIRKSWKNIW